MSEFVTRARALRDDIIGARAEMDDARRLPDAVAAKLAGAGFFRLCVPKVYGGAEASVLDTIAALETLAEADASAAWVAMIGATTGAMAAYLDADTAREIYGGAGAIVTGVYAPMGKASLDGDAYRVSGQWKWNSGGQNSHWLGGGCLVMEGGKPRMIAEGVPDARMVLFPARDARFIDTWHTSGLRGTGSGDMGVSDLRVPAARSVSLTADKPKIDAPLYKFPVFGLLAVGIAAVASGNATAALAEFKAVAAGKKMPNGRLLSERSATQALYASACADLGAARAYLHSEVGAAWREAEMGAEISLETRARVRLAATHLTRMAAEIVRRVQDFAGGSAVFSADPLQRRLRDAQTMTAHIMIAPATYELSGRALLGVPVATSEL